MKNKKQHIIIHTCSLKQLGSKQANNYMKKNIKVKPKIHVFGLLF